MLDGVKTQSELLSTIHSLRVKLWDAEDTLTRLHATREGDNRSLLVPTLKHPRHKGGHRRRILAAERLARLILDHVAEALVVCDTSQRIVRASQEAHRLGGRNLLFEPFEAAFPLCFNSEVFPDVRSLLLHPLHGRRLHGVEASLPLPCGGWVYLTLTAGPLVDNNGRVVGCIVTLTDISARKAVETQLQAAKMAAEAANQAKDDFMAALSHELRTPLAPVLISCSSLQKQMEIPEAVRQEMAMISRNVEQEARLIDDLLDLTRIARNKLELKMQTVDAHDLLQRAVERASKAIQDKQLRLTMELKATHHRLWADGDRLTQVFGNLINNAVKFTPMGGQIEIGSENVSNSAGPQPVWKMRIADSGIGIAPEVLDQLFEPFRQGGREITRQFGGLGLGLVISRRLIDLHGGQLRAASQGPGKGATFTMSLPAEICGAVLPASMPGIGQESNCDEPVEANPERPLRILLVDDHVDTIRTLSRLLESHGHHVVAADSVAEGLRCAEQNEVDLVISDLGLPDGTGLELMRRLVDRYHLKGIALSGYGMQADVDRSLEAGFKDHLVKPVNLPRMLAAIHRVAGQ